MKKKSMCAAFAALALAGLLLLPACGTWVPTPAATIPAATESPTAPAAAEEPTASAAEPPAGPLYFVVEEHLVGSWEDGAWRSLNDPSGRYEDAYSNRFYLKDILSQPRFALYTRGGKIGYSDFALINGGGGLGGFSEGDQTGLFAPYAKPAPEGVWPFSMEIALPATLGPELEDLAVPLYGYALRFSYEPVALATNSMADLNPFPGQNWVDTTWDWPTEEDYQALEGVLLANGITAEPSVSDLLILQTPAGEQRLLCATTPWDAGGSLRLAPEDGGSYSILLLRREDGGYETVYQRCLPYTSDVTAHFKVFLKGVYDLNSDGVCEICLVVGEWEGGHTLVLGRGADGVWAPVLRANWGT